MLQPNPISGRNADACMIAETFTRGTTVSWFHYVILGVRPIAGPYNALARARARCYAPRNRCAIEFGKQRFVAPKRVSLLRISLQTKAPLFHETHDTPMGSFRNSGNCGIRWRPNSPGYRISLAVVDIEAIQYHQMKMGVEIQGVAEALNEADSAAASFAV